MDKFFNNTESTILVLILIGLCVLTLLSVFVWHNMFMSALFTIGIFIWLWAFKNRNNF